MFEQDNYPTTPIAFNSVVVKRCCDDIEEDDLFLGKSSIVVLTIEMPPSQRKGISMIKKRRDLWAKEEF